MALVSMRELLDHAATHGYGIPAFNVNNLEQVQAVMAAADEVGAPVILQASAGARPRISRHRARRGPGAPGGWHMANDGTPGTGMGREDIGR